MSLKQKIKAKGFWYPVCMDKQECDDWESSEQIVKVGDIVALVDEVTKQIQEIFSEGTDHGYHWNYDGPDYARRRCEQIIDLYDKETLPAILRKVLAVLDGEKS